MRVKLFQSAAALQLIVCTCIAFAHTLATADDTFPLVKHESGLSDSLLAEAYKNHANNLQVQGRGTVVKLLPDDDDGSRHQRFIIRLSSGQTLLIAHNIDMAPRIESLHVGDRVDFYGVYEWNEHGGVIHWTHRDPDGSHVAGWLQHQGRMYK